jgi:hypothetical protein
MFHFKVQKLTRKLLALGILLGCLILLAWPQGMLADNCTNCDNTYNGAIDQCRSSYDQCLLVYSDAYCASQYQGCWDTASTTYVNCIQSCSSEYDPSHGGGGDPSRNSCVRGCDEVYWTCFENGGANTGTYQSCMSNGGNVEDCCFAERTICLGGC